MGTIKCRVHRAHNHGPRMAQALFLGTLLGVLTKVSGPFTLLNFGWQWFDVPGWFYVQFLAPLLVLTLFQTHCRHGAWSFLTGGAMVATFGISLEVFPLAGYVFAATRAEMWTNVLWALLWFAVGGGLLNLALNVAKDAFLGRVVIQDGTLCPICAYTVLHLPSPRCPECGAGFELAELNPNPPNPQGEWKRFAFHALGVGLVGTLIYLAIPSIVFRLAARGWSEVLPMREYLTLRPRHSADLLLGYLQNGDLDERAAAAYNLLFVLTPEYGGITAGSDTIRVIMSASINDRSAIVRRFAVQTLGVISHDSLYEILEQILVDSDATVRWTALAWAASGGISPDPRGTPFLIRALTDPDATVRDHACQRLMAITAQSFPCGLSAPAQSRLGAQATWRAWWISQQKKAP